MSAMNRVVTLMRTPLVTVERFDHAPGVPHRDPEREVATGHAINFIEGGGFRLRTTGLWHDAGTDRLFVTRPGLEFTCAHDDEFPCDACLSVRYSDEAVDSLRRAGAAGPRALLAPRTNRRAYLQRALTRDGAADPARIDALAGALWWSLTQALTPRLPLFPPARLHWFSCRIDRARDRIHDDFADPLPLATLAADAGLSAYHFARVFAELVGVPPHRYLTHVRLDAARRRLRAGASVTDTCFAVGFGSLSHFATAYRARFGERPSATGR
jgi:AraC-like DNA-binding protein